MRVVLTIAGSDSSGGAGIQADLKAIAANGGYGACAITAITAQNTQGVQAAFDIPPEMIRAQIDAVFADLDVVAVKSGMLGSENAIEVIAERMRAWRPAHYVLDPVMISKSGFPLLPPGCIDRLKQALLPLAGLVTPNIHEAQALSGMTIHTPAEAATAGRRILELGPQAVLVKGGHLSQAPATDVLVTGRGVEHFPGTFIDSPHTHGTGCTYASAIATHLGHGRPLVEAIQEAKGYVTEAIRNGLAIGRGVGPTDHFFFLRRPDGARWLERLWEERAPR